MDVEGTHGSRDFHSGPGAGGDAGSRGIRSGPEPGPARKPVPPGPPAASVPPMPRRPPAGGPGSGRRPVGQQSGQGFRGGLRPGDLRAWLRTPRPADAPGIFGLGHVPKPPEAPDRLSDRQLVGGALLALLGALFVWSFIRAGYLPVYSLIDALTPDMSYTAAAVVGQIGEGLIVTLLVLVFGRIGRWLEIWRRYLVPAARRLTDSPPAAAPGQGEGEGTAWPELCRAGHPEVAERLDADIRAGRMNDVDYARLCRAWESVGMLPGRLTAFTDAVLRHGAGACSHPSGMRDLPVRTARHDLFTGQVRIGTAPDSTKNPYAHRGAGIALDPGLLGTSLLVVGPPGSGKTGAVVRPVVEALALQALSGTAALVAVGPAEADLGPDDAFDVVIAIGNPSSEYDLDLYGGATDPDQAAACLATALHPEGESGGPESGNRRAQTALSQILGAFHAAHGRFPGVAELRELLDGAPAAFAALRTALDDAGAHAHQRDLEARLRQSGRGDDVGPLLADRAALLARPAFAGFFDVTGQGRPFSMNALEHPLRVRIVLPERGHAEASRILTRLVLAQFTTAVAARADRSLFACLVLDDAAHTVTAQTVRDVQRLRSVNAGAVLALRTLDDVPEALRTALLGSVGCRMALSGITTWDGRRFAESWGTTWVDERAVTRTPDRSGGLVKRTLRGVRKLFTGDAATTESVTTRKVERPLWSASELAHSVPPGHAVVSLTTVRGEHVPPVLVDLRG